MEGKWGLETIMFSRQVVVPVPHGHLEVSKVEEVAANMFVLFAQKKRSIIPMVGPLWSLRQKENQVGKRSESSVLHKV